MSTALAKPARYPTWFVMLTAFIYGGRKMAPHKHA
jgi:hypothetical protein